jgi:hypothetical protein
LDQEQLSALHADHLQPLNREIAIYIVEIDREDPGVEAFDLSRDAIAVLQHNDVDVLPSEERAGAKKGNAWCDLANSCCRGSSAHANAIFLKDRNGTIAGSQSL